MDLNLLTETCDQYIHLHADCIAVKGTTRSAIYDLTRHELVLFPIEHMEVLEYITSDKVGKLLKKLEVPEKDYVMEFIDFLNQNEMITMVKDPHLFPPISEQWDVPNVIQNAVIDIDKNVPNFRKIISELNDLACPFIQVRAFSDILTINIIEEILLNAKNSSIEGIEFLVKYSSEITEADYTKLIQTQNLISSLTIHSSTADKEVLVPFGDRDLAYSIDKSYTYTTQCIDSEVHCGIITLKHLNAPTVSNFFETKLFNGCLNRKIAVDVNGDIKNCPSMRTVYGNISTHTLVDAVKRNEFKQMWGIHKDQIEVCKGCEFRYACSDCRAYLEKPEDKYSKPLKCGYNPHTQEWEDWSDNPLKQAIMKQYLVPASGDKKISVN